MLPCVLPPIACAMKERRLLSLLGLEASRRVRGRAAHLGRACRPGRGREHRRGSGRRAERLEGDPRAVRADHQAALGAATRARDDRRPRPCRLGVTGSRLPGPRPGDQQAHRRPRPRRRSTLDARAIGSPRARAGTVRRVSQAFAPMINGLGPIADAEAVDHRGRLLIAGYAVKRLSASLSPPDRRESRKAVPRGAHQARSALSATRRDSTVAGRAARETPGVLGRNGEAPSDRSSGASVYRPSPLVGDERKMAPRS